MATVQEPGVIFGEIAEFLASAPTREQLLKFRPSEQLQQRIRDLLAKQNAGKATAEDQRELDQIEHAERLMRMVKARIRKSKAS